MRNLLVGVIVGVALASTAFLLFGRRYESLPVDLTGSVSQAPSFDVTEAEAAVSRDTGPAAEPAAAASRESEETLDADFEASGLTDEALEQLVANANRARDELSRRQLLAEWSNQPPPIQPITLPSEFAWLAVNPSDTHERIQREPVDWAWAPAMEAQLALYFSLRPEITTIFGYPTINCRSTWCELAFVVPEAAKAQLARQQSLTRARLPTALARAVADFSEQPWANQFSFVPRSSIRSAPNIQDGVATLLWFLPRQDG